MEFNIQRNTFVSAIRRTLGIVEKKTTMPILNNVLIRAKATGVTIVATDMEITLVANYEAEIVSEGEITVSAKRLYDIIKEDPEDVVHVETTASNVLILTCQKSVYRINGLSPRDFPSLGDGGEGGGPLSLTKVDRQVIGELIAKTIFAVSTDETRVNLTGGFLEVDGEEGKRILRMVATDGHRMAIVESMAVEELLQLEKGVIIPRKGMLEVRKLVEENTGDLFVGVERNMCVVKIAKMLLKISLIDAEFPDYRRVIPKEKGVLFNCDKDEVLHALRRINVISSEGFGGVIVTLKENRMVLTSSDQAVGEGNDQIDILYKGEEVVVAYNVGYLMSAIEVIDEGTVAFEIGTGQKPTIIKGEGNNSYRCIVMPLRLE